jgi:putative FmdB family regulatory protein
MPIFEYKCDSCGTKFEKLLRRSDDLNALSCPDCGEKHLSQQYSTFAARANGSPEPQAGSCPSGMCSNPGMCGRN